MGDVHRCATCGGELSPSDVEGLCPRCLIALAWVGEGSSVADDDGVTEVSSAALPAAGSLERGTRIGPYEVAALIGRGGMGEVYRAIDRRLGRDVAIKVLQTSSRADPARLLQFEREARAAGTLSHPAVLAIHDIGSHEGAPYIVSELLDGETLRERLHAGPLPVADAIEHALHLARAMGVAHGRGILHRDLKPENLFLTRDGGIKILDFGLADLREARPVELAGTAVGTPPAPVPGLRAGTPGYMSPEQASGALLGPPSDVFSIGLVLYEMLTGRRFLTGHLEASGPDGTPVAVETPDGVPADLRRILRRALARDPRARYVDASALAQDLAACQRQRRDRGTGPSRRQRRLAWLGAVVLVGLAGVTAWLWRDRARTHWARTVALPEIERLSSERTRFMDAYRLLRDVEQVLPDDRQVEAAARLFSGRFSVSTVPPGAEVAIADVPARSPGPEWIVLGTAPLDDVRLPFGYLWWRVRRDGYQPAHAGRFPVEGGVYGNPRPSKFEFLLEPMGGGHPGMVLVPAGDVQTMDGRAEPLPAFHVDRFEVTNREFKAFVDDGGYGRREFWTEPFERDGVLLPFDEAMDRFRDSTGSPGPATWLRGSFREGQEDFPVSGISWFEAAAYAVFARKRLPTVYEWDRASGMGVAHQMAVNSNFNGSGPARVGSFPGLGPHGTYDSAGNVKEWCWNRTGTKRFIRGGSWKDPTYRFADFDADSPWAREATHGFRCVRSEELPRPETLTPVELKRRDFSTERPPSDSEYALYRNFYQYDRAPLDARLESADEPDGSQIHGRLERISFAAAYNAERVPGLLWLPRHARPPYQVVIFFPGVNAVWERSSAGFRSPHIESMVASGRAVLLPIYKGMYERPYAAPGGGPAELRERVVRFYQDLARAIDYVETRPDLDADKVAYFGFSMGASFGPIFLAVDPRLKAGVLLSGGAGRWFGASNPFGTGPLDPPAPELDAMSFAARVTAPVLMVNGLNDFIFPVAESQRPLFERLGTPPARKRHAVLPGGHAPDSLSQSMKEVLDWLDAYLGRVDPA